MKTKKDQKHALMIDVVDAKDLAPIDFWQNYISKRKPVLIKGHLTDPQWKATQTWSIDYLKSKAGQVPIKVEHRNNPQDTFGKGIKIDMTFDQALTRISSGDTSLYITTQDVPLGPDGHPEIFAPPTTHLVDDFPIQPALFGNLVPQQINIWMGCTEGSKDGATTGLHHDFHDNLYVLISGKKRFRLFPPQLAPQMYVHGNIQKIHKNGRIVYKGSGDVLADGSDGKEVKAWRAKRDAEMELAAAEHAVDRGEPGSKERLARAEDVLDRILEESLFMGSGGGMNNNDGDDDDDFSFWGNFQDDYDIMEQATSSKNNKSKTQSSHKKKESEPDSFSKIDLNLPQKELRKRFPLFPGLESCIECEVNAGEMLYIPASWFHEVTSYNSSSSSSSKATKATGVDKKHKHTDTTTNNNNNSNTNAHHLALNYWMHPPDNLISTQQGFDMPYTSDYWPSIWKERKERYRNMYTQKVDNANDDDDAHRSNKKRKHESTHTREMTAGEKAHFLRGIQGLFGYGRRHYLYKFVNAKWKQK